MVGNLQVDVNQRLFRCCSIPKDVHDEGEEAGGLIIEEGGEGVGYPPPQSDSEGLPTDGLIVQSGSGGVRQVPCGVIGFVSRQTVHSCDCSTPLSVRREHDRGAASQKPSRPRHSFLRPTRMNILKQSLSVHPRSCLRCGREAAASEGSPSIHAHLLLVGLRRSFTGRVSDDLRRSWSRHPAPEGRSRARRL